MISNRSLFVLSTSTAGCQFVEPRFEVDSRTNAADGRSGQERESLALLRARARRVPAEEQVFSSITTPLVPVGVTARSGSPSPLKSPTAKGRPTWPYLTAACKVPSPLPKSTETPSPASAKSSLPSPFKSATTEPKFHLEP